MNIDTQHFKEKLNLELKKLEEELATVGVRNPNNSADWEPKTSTADIDTADRNEVADQIESYEENTAILRQLETELNAVKHALEKINSEGAYGTCEISGKPIELDRLEAYPAARTCKEHMNDRQ